MLILSCAGVTDSNIADALQMANNMHISKEMSYEAMLTMNGYLLKGIQWCLTSEGWQFRSRTPRTDLHKYGSSSAMEGLSDLVS